MVWNEIAVAWVHAGMSGFTSSGIYLEMQASDYYHHRPIKRADPTIVDIGGHVGIYSREMAQRYPEGWIVCIEAHPENAELARRNLDEYRNTSVIEAAVSYEPAAVLHGFSTGSNSGGSQLLPEGAKTFANDTEFDKRIYPKIVSLEELAIGPIDLLKLDCEGSEYSILRNAKLENVKEIVGEWHKVPGVPRFDRFCREHLPGWRLETWETLDGPLGMFRLTPGDE